MAAIAGLSYQKAREVANSLGIYADDECLWSETAYIRKLLDSLGFKHVGRERPFEGWNSLPDLALLSIKWHEIKSRSYWHWVVFVREDGKSYVLDSSARLKKNVRTDFGRMKPRWFIEVVASGTPDCCEHSSR